MVRTFRNIISDIEDFCEDHNQIGEFGWGQLSNITTKEHDFTMLFLQPTQTQIDGHLMTLSFDMYIFDLVKQDKTNLLDVMNDTLLIGNDVIKKFWDNEEEYEWMLIEEGVGCEPFEAKFDDYTAGWVFSIEIEVENRLNLCEVPEDLTIPEVAETLYYIAAPTDIVGSGMVNTINASSDDAGGSKITTHDATDWEADDILYIGLSSNLGSFTIGDILISNDIPHNEMVLTTTTYKSDGYQRVAKLTSFTTATYSNTLTDVSQRTKEWLQYAGTDMTLVYPKDTIIRVTKGDGTYIYDIITEISFKSGFNDIRTYMGYFQAEGTSTLTIDKMTGIS